jgi:hypothetical protein
VREGGRIVGGEEWQLNVYDREEWKKLLRVARNRHILHVAVEGRVSIVLHLYEVTEVFENALFGIK